MADGISSESVASSGGNTFDAHRLLHLASERDKQPELKERLLLATFTEGEPMSDRATLVRHGVSGAQPADVLLQVLNRAYDERRPLTMINPVTGDAPMCDDESCAV